MSESRFVVLSLGETQLFEDGTRITPALMKGCIICGQFPPTQFVEYDGAPGSPAREGLEAAFGAPPAGKRRVIVYFLCAAHPTAERQNMDAAEDIIFRGRFN